VRYLILSDIHANREALEAVERATRGRYDRLVCLGDVVGYGPDPAFAIEWLRAQPAALELAIVRGNHDKAVASVGVNEQTLDWFHPVARQAALWTASVLSEADRVWLDALPEGPWHVSQFRICHGSPLDEDEYLSNRFDATPVLTQGPAAEAGSLVFFGHTHQQGGFSALRTAGRLRVNLLEGARTKAGAVELALDALASYLINPGAVGQPRDGDPRAAYALFDSATRTVTFERVAYDVASVQAKIAQAGLPKPLAARLALGK
jgi:predicted phosphodiesterase